MVTARPGAANFVTHFYHTKPRSRKEEGKEIVFFLSFVPLRLCVNHTVTSPEAVTLEPPACRAQLGSGSIYQPKTSVCVARWMLKQVQYDAWEEYRSAISAPLREPFFSSPQRRLGPIPSIGRARRYPARRARLQPALERRCFWRECASSSLRLCAIK
jgi:hypothetical protein